jgi:hypothetical protein
MLHCISVEFYLPYRLLEWIDIKRVMKKWEENKREAENLGGWQTASDIQWNSYSDQAPARRIGGNHRRIIVTLL